VSGAEDASSAQLGPHTVLSRFHFAFGALPPRVSGLM
jgi:hypothetical protein